MDNKLFFGGGLLALAFLLLPNVIWVNGATSTAATTTHADSFLKSLDAPSAEVTMFNERLIAIVDKAQKANKNWYESLDIVSRKDFDKKYMVSMAANLEAILSLRRLEVPKKLATSTRAALVNVRDNYIKIFSIKNANIQREYQVFNDSGLTMYLASANLIGEQNAKYNSAILKAYNLSTDGQGYYKKTDKKGNVLSAGSISIFKQQELLAKTEAKPVVIKKLLSKDCYDDITSPDRYFKKLNNPRPIDTIVVHTSFYQPDNDPAIKRISNDIYSVDGIMDVWNFYGVGPHYLIDRQGTIYQTAEEKNVAWHAGASLMPAPDGRTGVGIFSIGIELLCHETDNLTDEQKLSLAWLVNDIGTRYQIKHVLGHNDIANKAEDESFRNEVNKLGTIGNNIKTDPWGLVWHQINLIMKKLDTQYGH